MAGIALESRSDVAETLFIPLYIRAMESRRSDALIRDEKAIELVNRMDYDFSWIKLRVHDQVGIILRLREFDRRVRDYLVRHPDAVVVHIGCGLDTRFERVDNHQDDWYDLDLPEVIALRQKLIEKTPRCHLLGCSVFDSSWMDTVSVHEQRPGYVGTRNAALEDTYPLRKKRNKRSIDWRRRSEKVKSDLE